MAIKFLRVPATKFKLINANGGCISTALFADFDDDPERGRVMAKADIQCKKDRWETQPMFAGENLHVIEE